MLMTTATISRISSGLKCSASVSWKRWNAAARSVSATRPTQFVPRAFRGAPSKGCCNHHESRPLNSVRDAAVAGSNPAFPHHEALVGRFPSLRVHAPLLCRAVSVSGHDSGASRLVRFRFRCDGFHYLQERRAGESDAVLAPKVPSRLAGGGGGGLQLLLRDLAGARGQGAGAFCTRFAGDQVPRRPHCEPGLRTVAIAGPRDGMGVRYSVQHFLDRCVPRPLRPLGDRGSRRVFARIAPTAVSYTHLRAHET